MHRRYIPLLPSALCLLLLLSGCGADPQSPAPAPTAAPALPVSDGAVPGDEPDAGTAADAMAGSYYNDYLGMTLSLVGSGACTLHGGGTDAVGTYTVSPDGLTLDFGAVKETASCDEHGDITIEGRTGWFLRDWTLWGITEAEAGTPASPASVDMLETLDNGDGTLRSRDFADCVAVTYPTAYVLLPDRLSEALAVADGSGAYVIGRNVTESLGTFSGDAEGFLEDYIRTYTFADFDTLYNGLTAYAELQVFSDSTDGRLAAGTLRLSNPDHDIAATVILYTSAYADGTENYICKTFFVPAAESSRQADLSAAVTDMGAVRRK